jgi:hypothetical protein
VTITPRARNANPVDRVGVLALALLLLVPGCGAAAVRVGADCDIPTSDVGSVPGGIGYGSEPNDVALFVDDGHGNRVEHRADEIHPMVSASKVLNLVAYAHAVRLGRVDPGEPVRVGDWERWSVLGSEQAHAQALDALGIPRTGGRAADPNRMVTVDQIANQMIIWSDNAAPDFLRARLGDQAVLDAARVVGWNDPELPSTTGFLVSFFTPELLPPAEDRTARRSTEWELARRYANDPAFRADVDNRPAPAGKEQREQHPSRAG